MSRSGEETDKTAVMRAKKKALGLDNRCRPAQRGCRRRTLLSAKRATLRFSSQSNFTQRITVTVKQGTSHGREGLG